MPIPILVFSTRVRLITVSDKTTPDDISYTLRFTGAPIFISKPHYLDVDPEVATNITGLRGPDRQLDDTFLDIEPVRPLRVDVAFTSFFPPKDHGGTLSHVQASSGEHSNTTNNPFVRLTKSTAAFRHLRFIMLL